MCKVLNNFAAQTLCLFSQPKYQKSTNMRKENVSECLYLVFLINYKVSIKHHLLPSQKKFLDILL